MANKKHVEILKTSIDTWNQWREDNPEIRPDLSEVNLEGINLHKANLSDTTLYKANLFGANLSNAILFGAQLQEANLIQVDFSEARLVDTDLSGAFLNNTNFTGATIFWPVFDKVYLRGGDFSRVSFERSMLSGVDFSHTTLCEANFRGAYLDKTIFYKANLSGAFFNGILSEGANFTKANLSQADFGSAPLMRANFTDANLEYAKFIKTSLFKAIFTGANLKETDFTEATAGYTSFNDVDLNNVKGLDTVGHYGPSYIDVHTLYRAIDKLPRNFLQGIGLADSLLDKISESFNAAKYSACYISFIKEDRNFAERLFTELQKRDISCWLINEITGDHNLQLFMKADDYPNEEKGWPGIFQPMRRRDKLLFVFSKASLKSRWVDYEVETALRKEQEWQKQILVPICLDDGIFTDSRSWVVGINNSRPVIRFDNWLNETSFTKALVQLVDHLKT